MHSMDYRTIKLLSRSGFVLIFLSMGGTFAMAALRISEPTTMTVWQGLLGNLFLAIAGIAVYYLSLGVFAWTLAKKRSKKAVPKKAGK